MTSAKQHTLDLMIRNATLAADAVAVRFQGTEAERTRAVVKRAVEFLVDNRMVEVIPEERWPEWLVVDPRGKS